MGPEAGDVLLVEDRRSDARLLKEALEVAAPQLRLVHHLDVAAAMADLQERARTSRDPPALIVLDIHLPEESGLDLLDRLRKMRRFTQVPVVVLSASEAAVDVEEAKRARVDAYFLKPSNMEEYAQLAADLAQLWASRPLAL